MFATVPPGGTDNFNCGSYRHFQLWDITGRSKKPLAGIDVFDCVSSYEKPPGMTYPAALVDPGYYALLGRPPPYSVLVSIASTRMAIPSTDALISLIA